MDPVSTTPADRVENVDRGRHDPEPFVELVDDDHQHRQRRHVLAARPHPSAPVEFLGVVDTGVVADRFTAGDLTPQCVQEALHQRLVFFKVGDDPRHVRHPAKRVTADPPLRSANTNCNSSGGCASISDSSTVRTRVDLPEPVVPDTTPCGPSPPSSRDFMSRNSSSPLSERLPNGIRSRERLVRASRRLPHSDSKSISRILDPVVGQDVSGADLRYPLADLLVGFRQPPAGHLLSELLGLRLGQLVGESEEPPVVVDHHPGVAVTGQRLDHPHVIGESQHPLRVAGPQRRTGQVEEGHTVDTVDADHVFPLRVVDVGDDHVVGSRCLRRRASVPRSDFLFIGFGIKAGIIPFHKWLPYAHPASPSNISALMSGVMIKVAIYGLLRFVLLMPMELWWGILILVVGTTSAILGVIYALKEHDIKRLLAYHSIENIGIILIGIGLYVIFALSGLQAIATLALIGALFHTLNHAIFKSLLFMTSGSVINSTETRNIEDMGGLIKRMPYTALLFLIGAVSISALPPFNGFVSELMIFQAFFQSSLLANPALEMLLITSLAIFALTSALAAACFVKAFGITFLALPRSEGAKKAKEAPKLMLIGPALLAIFCVVLGVFSFQIFGAFGFSFPIPNMLLVGPLLACFLWLLG